MRTPPHLSNCRRYNPAQTEQSTLTVGACERHPLPLGNIPHPMRDTPDQVEFFRTQNVDSKAMFGIPLSNPA